ncbi:aldo/keto reductase [Pseudoroseomonas cervicalis]|uniref:Oxidoreductase, aldo/keto reductase family protein n=1 Tax=Pseudoroseomonas cervicalis ATCC 49957 TaxID=525371 RepID=D5RRK3_9PROT|nr:aldo/keto reductase [Pseudoroseomonas cervicalis]EFH10067.1 oxidoreductase, aldo/keto reductase family protein [Pseudoroseomonas cervicalis ATCC 49957]
MIPTLTTDRISIPKLGLGTWKLAGAEGQAAVESAIALGYRHIDTADRYGNEEAVGAGLKASGVARGELFVTSKVWFDNLAPDAIRRSLDGSLRKLGTGHLDLFLVHWPTPEMDLAAVAQTMQAAKDEGLTRHWGVSNFPPALMRQLEALGAKPACLQVEYHALLSQQRLLDWCRPRGIALTAYSPLGQGALADQPVLEEIGRKHGASALQVALAWLLRQEGVVAIPKAGRRESQQANLDAVPLAAKLDAEDVAAIDALPKDRRRVNPDFAPAWDSF